MTVDLSNVWTPFKAAAAAIKNTLQPPVIKDLVVNYSQALAKLNAELNMYLTEVWPNKNPKQRQITKTKSNNARITINQ